jgi:nucleolar complex protein 3
MCRVAVKCLCGILAAVPHFNFMSDVLQVVVPKLNSPDERTRGLTTASLKLLLHRGTHGDVMLEAVQLIADLVRTTKCKCHPNCVRALMALEFPDISRDDVSKGVLPLNCIYLTVFSC